MDGRRAGLVGCEDMIMRGGCCGGIQGWSGEGVVDGWFGGREAEGWMGINRENGYCDMLLEGGL